MRNQANVGIGPMVLPALLALLGCGGNGTPAEEEFTDAHRAQIEAEVGQIMADLVNAAKQADMESIAAGLTAEGSVCVWGATVFDCRQLLDRHRGAWTSGEETWLERQEMDGEEIRVMAISPTVAIGVLTVEENRAIFSTGDVVRASFASLSVFVLEGEGWKLHTGQQASWPVG
jgi:hypothetical protein